jgi:hypothetical protein
MRRMLLAVIILVVVSGSAFAAKDPADYNLKVIVLEQQWTSHNVYRNEFKGTGRGNIWDVDGVRAFDFKYECDFGLRRTVRNQPYIGKWKKPQLRLEILAPKIGTEGKYQDCELQTTVHAGVYMIGRTGLTEMAQEDFNKWGAQDQAARARLQENAASRAASTVSKLSIASTPDGAEIAIDGEFMGDTPSLLELGPGEHSITVTKPGYKAWEKKITLAPGDVKLTADLQPAGN